MDVICRVWLVQMPGLRLKQELAVLADEGDLACPQIHSEKVMVMCAHAGQRHDHA